MLISIGSPHDCSIYTSCFHGIQKYQIFRVYTEYAASLLDPKTQ